MNFLENKFFGTLLSFQRTTFTSEFQSTYFPQNSDFFLNFRQFSLGHFFTVENMIIFTVALRISWGQHFSKKLRQTSRPLNFIDAKEFFRNFKLY